MGCAAEELYVRRPRRRPLPSPPYVRGLRGMLVAPQAFGGDDLMYVPVTLSTLKPLSAAALSFPRAMRPPERTKHLRHHQAFCQGRGSGDGSRAGAPSVIAPVLAVVKVPRSPCLPLCIRGRRTPAASASRCASVSPCLSHPHRCPSLFPSTASWTPCRCSTTAPLAPMPTPRAVRLGFPCTQTAFLRPFLLDLPPSQPALPLTTPLLALSSSFPPSGRASCRRQTAQR